MKIETGNWEILEHKVFRAVILLPPKILTKFIPGRHRGFSAKKDEEKKY